MPIPPPPPPPPGGPPPPPTFSQANTTPPKLNRDEAKGRGALLSDIHKGAKLKKVGVVNDRSAPVIEKSKGGGSRGLSGAVQPMGGLFHGGVPKLQPVGALTPPGTHSSAPRPLGPAVHPNDADVPAQQASSPEHSRSQRPSLPDLSRPLSGGSPNSGMKHSSSAPPPPPPLSRRGNAPPAPTQKAAPVTPSYNREKPLPPTPGQRGASPAPVRDNAPPLPVKPPASPNNNRRPPTSGGSSSSLAPPPPPYRQAMTNGPSSPVNEAAPELPQRHNSLSKRPSSGPGHTPTRGPAPPPPPSPSPSGGRPPPPAREPPGRGAAPPPPGSTQRNGGRDAPPPPPPPFRGSPSEPHSRGKPPPPPPSRTPAGPPPPPPPIRNGHNSISRSFVDDFESKYSFHPLHDFPAPEEYRHFTKIYPSKANRVMMGAPPAPPVGR
ncbi:WAS/WASL-interacting protein family member 2b isoform X2 [Esox lucius]|uniref:WH2 domain-containing protein n=1 Tax=Esox lucius TaxID=8010 RepID=A0A3P8YGL9_ESOLU|nr:WAS/WASL-interacting protein family member 2b isoform X2 [Esox lucius]